MEGYTPTKNDKTEDIRMVNDFRDELERIKQKLASDFTKYSELDKIKNKEKSSFNNINHENILYNKMRETKENKPKEKAINIPTIEELRIKYGLEQNKKKISETESNISTNTNQNSIINPNSNINNQYQFIKKIDIKKLNNENIRNNRSSYNNSKIYKNNYYNEASNNQNITTVEHNDFRKKYTNIEDDNDINDKNNLTFKNNNINKLQILKTETDMDNNKDNYNYNYNYNYINREQRQIESPIKFNNNSNNNTSILLNSKLDQQIKLINEKSENNRLEEEKTQMKIKQI